MPQLAMMQRNDSKAVRSTMVTEMPSTPTRYSMLKVGIQLFWVQNCMSVMPRSKPTKSWMASSTGTAAKASDVHRCTLRELLGKKASTTAPTAGINHIQVSSRL